MAFPTTNQCCCGCTLRTGVLILAYIGVIGSILQVLQYAALHDAPVDHTKTDADKLRVQNPVASIIHGILSAVLLYGVYKESRPAILSVVYIQLGLCVVGAIGVVIAAIILQVFWILPIYAVALLIGLYFVWVEYSYAEELLNQTSNPKSFA